MPPVRFTHVVSYSSEDSIHKSDNLLVPDGSKKWRCKDPGEKQLSATLQLDKLCRITSIDIGNDGSAFVEIQVRRQGQDDFRVLLASSSFLSPLESRNEQNLSRVRMFGSDKLAPDVAKEKWNQVKVVCTQPFNKHIKFGLSFITLHSASEDPKPSSGGGGVKLGAFTLKEEDDENVDVGSYFAKRRTTEGRLSAAASLRSETTLASLALEQAEKTSLKRKCDEPEFYQLKRPKVEPEVKKKLSDQAKLPRRNELPGEETDTKVSDKTPKRKLEEEEKKARKRERDSSEKKKTKDKTESKGEHSKQTNRQESRPKRTKLFKRLFEGVVFVLSGYQNPLRSNLRSKALEMGAKYKGDWDSTCTHLVCAFANTPKFQQVKGKGKIVRKDWIEESYSKRIRFPWRRFCLDPKDKGEESEEEVWEQIESLQEAKEEPTAEEDLDTDEEIEQIKRENAAAGTDPYNENTDDEDDYGGDTEDEEGEERANTSEMNLPELPTYFEGLRFLLYGDFRAPDRRELERLIVAAGGSSEAYMGSKVKYVVTESEWDDKFRDALRTNPKVRFVRPEFVKACAEEGKCLSSKTFAIQE